MYSYAVRGCFCPPLRSALVTSSCLVRCSKDVRLPASMQRAMAAEAEATREAKANVSVACYIRSTLNPKVKGDITMVDDGDVIVRTTSIVVVVDDGV